jgi:uncharacterized integral membrane protein
MDYILFNKLKTIKMGLEELFENKDRYKENTRERRYPGSDGTVYESQQAPNEERDNINWLDILEKIRSNKKLKLFVILAGILVLIIIIVLIIVLLPLLVKLINGISQNGLQGTLNDISGFIDKILKGT